MTRLAEITEEALNLPVDEREYLANQLTESLPAPQLTEIEKAWMPILDQRLADYESGKTKPIPASQVFQEIRKEMGWQ